MKKYIDKDFLISYLLNYITKLGLEDEIPNIVQKVIESLSVWNGGEF